MKQKQCTSLPESGGGLLADLILGHTPVVAVEWDAYACKVLRERAADGWFPDLSVWEGDVRLFNPSEYTGVVDCIHAGFPCQDISVSGKQAGVSEGTRSGLYREVLRIAGVVRPKQLFLENVSAILSCGLGTVLGDLAALGYDCRWLCIRASDVGAPHHRDRWFLLANTKSCGDRRDGGELSRTDEQQAPERQKERVCKSINAGEGWFQPNIPDTNNDRRGYGAFQYIGGQLESSANAGNDGKEGTLADTECQRLPRSGGYEQSIGSTPCRDWQAVGAINGGTSNFWATEPELGGLVDGFSNRVCTSEGEINANATQSSSEQDLQNMRKPVQSEGDAKRTKAGCKAVLEAGVLQSFMREHSGHLNPDGTRVLIQGKETPQASLRGLRTHEVPSRSPCGSGQDEQPSGEHSDTLQTLSRLLAHGAEADRARSGGENAPALWWAAEPDVGRVATGVSNRVGQLKGYGNAQVPLQAAAAYRLLGGL